MNRRAFLSASFGAVLCGVVAGCNNAKAKYALVPVKGVVTYQGKPLPSGFRVEFAPADGSRASFGNLADDGTFEAIHSPQQKGVKTGTCKVQVYWNADPTVTPVPDEYKDLIARYGFTGTENYTVEISKKESNLEIKFE